MKYFLSLGANVDEREKTLSQAISLIREQIGDIPVISDFYYSPSWGYQSEHEYCNLCCLLLTDRLPNEVLILTQQIEKTLGRTAKTQQHNYQDRTIDIDIIRVFDNQGAEVFISTPQLTIPHPLYNERPFVLIPLKQIINQI